MSANRSSPAGHETWSKRLADRVFGFDYFIAYAWRDGRNYAALLSEKLRREGLECFLDTSEYLPGDDLERTAPWALRRSRALILVGTPAALESAEVRREVTTFAGLGRRIIPVDVGGCLERLSSVHPLANFITPNVLRITESTGSNADGPSPESIDRIRGAFVWERRSRQRRRWIQRIAGALGILFIAAVVLGGLAWIQRTEAIAQRDAANRHLATASWLLASNAGEERVGASTVSPIQAAHHLHRAAIAAHDAGLARQSEIATLTARVAARRLQYSLVHPGEILGVLASVSGDRVLSWDDAGHVRVWDATTGEMQGASLLHSNPVLGAAMNESADRIVTWDAKGKAHLWIRGTADIAVPLETQLPVLGSVFAPRGDWLLTWEGAESEDESRGEVRCWRSDDGAALPARGRLEAPPGGLVLATNGSAFLTWSSYLETAGRAILWRWDGDRLDPMELPLQGSALGACFSPDGTRFLTWSGALFREGFAQLWDATQARPIGEAHHFDSHIEGASFSPDGDLFVLWANAGSASVAALFSSVGASQIGTNRTMEWSIAGVEWSSDALNLAIWGGDLLRGGASFVGWDLDSSKSSMPHDKAVVNATFGSNRSELLTVTSDGVVRVWDTLEAGLKHVPLGHGTAFAGSMFLPGRQRLISWGENVARGWRIDEVLAKSLASDSSNAVLGCDISPDGMRFVTWGGEPGSSGKIDIWDAETGDRITAPLTHPDEVTGARFSPQGGLLLSWSGIHNQGEARATRIRDGTTVVAMPQEGPAFTGMAVDAKETRLLIWRGAGPGETGEVLICDLSQAGKVIQRIRHALPVQDVLWSRDATRVLTVASETFGSGEWGLWSAQGEAVMPMQRTDEPVSGAFFSHDGARFLVAQSTNGAGMAYWRNSLSGDVLGLAIHHPQAIEGCVLSPDGKWMGSWTSGSELKVWSSSALEPEEVCAVRFPAAVLGCVFSPDSRRLLAWATDGTARIWDVIANRPVGRPLQHSHRVLAGSLSTDGEIALTWTVNGPARLWSTEYGLLLATLAPQGVAAMTPDARRVLVGDTLGGVRLWQGLPADPDLTCVAAREQLEFRSATRLEQNGELRTLREDEWKALKRPVGAGK